MRVNERQLLAYYLLAEGKPGRPREDDYSRLSVANNRLRSNWRGAKNMKDVLMSSEFTGMTDKTALRRNPVFSYKPGDSEFDAALARVDEWMNEGKPDPTNGAIGFYDRDSMEAYRRDPQMRAKMSKTLSDGVTPSLHAQWAKQNEHVIGNAHFVGKADGFDDWGAKAPVDDNLVQAVSRNTGVMGDDDFRASPVVSPDPQQAAVDAGFEGEDALASSYPDKGSGVITTEVSPMAGEPPETPAPQPDEMGAPGEEELFDIDTPDPGPAGGLVPDQSNPEKPEFSKALGDALAKFGESFGDSKQAPEPLPMVQTRGNETGVVAPSQARAPAYDLVGGAQNPEALAQILGAMRRRGV